MKIFRQQTMFQTPDGRVFPVKTILLTEEKEIHCFDCGNLIKDRDIVFFCLELKKCSCWNCNQKDDLPCYKYMPNFKSHIDLLGEIHIVEKVQDVLNG